MKRCAQVLLAVAMCWAAAGVDAHEGHGEAEAKAFTSREQYAPTPVPDRVVLTWSGDPTTSVDVSWRTQLGVADPVIEWAPADELRGNLAAGMVPTARRVAGESETFTSDLGDATVHSGRISGLAPTTMYVYRVGDDEHWSEWHQFRTASDKDEPFTFVYFGDAQNAIRSLWSRVIREANQHAPRSAFHLHAGDLINHSDSDGEWGEWFEAGGWLNGMIPTIATPGNHEYGDGLTRHWRPQFSFPMNGPSDLKETVYWIDYQGMRIISLNSNEGIAEQAKWLEEVLSDPDRPKWTTVTFHHPIFSAAKERDNPLIRAAWRPILERHGVDLVLQGHDHAYARSGLGGPGNVPSTGDDAAVLKTTGNVADGVRRKSSSTVYVVSVSGPKMYELQEKWEVPRVASGAQLFQVIRVSRDEIRYEARLATGELYDAFRLAKDDAGVSTLTEEVPPSAEIRE
ncbi:MAG: fibronectin type III domain-containing protein [Lacipirellulaceae bacterium]